MENDNDGQQRTGPPLAPGLGSQLQTDDSPLLNEALTRVPAAAAREVARQLGQPLKPGLYLVATPIGNLGDITLRALSVLAEADMIYCEDTRRSGILMQHFSLSAPLRPYHEHNAAAQRPRLIADLERGKRVALISDAGTPLVSDPGYKLVRDVLDTGHPVVSIPGASAALTALICAGLPTDAFYFAGFLPPKAGARLARIKDLQGIDATLVFYEAPTRMAATLADLGNVLGPRHAAVARELTKLHETISRGTLAELAERFASAEERGEFVILIGPPAAAEVSDAAIAAALEGAMEEMRLKDAAKTVSGALGVSRNRVYDIGLKLKGKRSG